MSTPRRLVAAAEREREEGDRVFTPLTRRQVACSAMMFHVRAAITQPRMADESTAGMPSVFAKMALSATAALRSKRRRFVRREQMVW